MITLSNADTFEDAKALHKTINKALAAIEWEDDSPLSVALIAAINELRRENIERIAAIRNNTTD